MRPLAASAPYWLQKNLQPLPCAAFKREIGGIKIAKQQLHITDKPAERALLIGVKTGKQLWKIDDSLDELEQLAATAGVEVVGRVTQKMGRPNPATLIGSGKLEELKQARDEAQ